MIAHTVPEGAPAMPLDRYLKRAWPLVPGHVFRELYKKKDVRVNGARSDGTAIVRGGDALTLYVKDDLFAPEPSVLWTDDKLIVAVKPQGLPVDVDRDGVGADTLLTRLQTRWPNAALCHRLDAATGGIVLAAADPAVLEQALEAFKAHGVQKQYHALALHPFVRREYTLKAYLMKDARRAEVRVLDHPQSGAKPIETRCRALFQAAPDLWHVALEPVTGRTHQLRAHLAHIGHPLLGDDKYGDRAANRAHPKIPLCLWHEKLTISPESPLINYRERVFEAPAPRWL